MLCAGYEEGGKDTCKGDSGGPLVCQRCSTCNFYLAGIVSFGEECAKAGGFYGRYTKVSAHESWIREYIDNDFRKTLEAVERSSGSKTCDRVYRNFWSSWGGWSPCSETCGKDGIHKRSRVCEKSAGFEEDCVGPETEVKSCHVHECPGNCCEFLYFEMSEKSSNGEEAVDYIFTRLETEETSQNLKNSSFMTTGDRVIYQSYDNGIELFLYYYVQAGQWWLGPNYKDNKGHHYKFSDAYRVVLLKCQIQGQKTSS